MSEQKNEEIMDQIINELDGFFNPGKAREDREVGLVLIVYPMTAAQGKVSIGTNSATEEQVANLMRNMLVHYDTMQAAKAEAEEATTQ